WRDAQQQVTRIRQETTSRRLSRRPTLRGKTVASPGGSSGERGGDTMKKAVVLLPLLVALFPLSAVADDTLKFRGGIGVLPVASGVGLAATAEVVNRNIVRGVQPAGPVWVIPALPADVKSDGRIRVDGRGLLLGGGNLIGFTADASVFATLICEAALPFTERSTNAAGVALEPNGDFPIDDVLFPAPPAVCAGPGPPTP